MSSSSPIRSAASSSSLGSAHAALRVRREAGLVARQQVAAEAGLLVEHGEVREPDRSGAVGGLLERGLLDHAEVDEDRAVDDGHEDDGQQAGERDPADLPREGHARMLYEAGVRRRKVSRLREAARGCALGSEAGEGGGSTCCRAGPPTCWSRRGAPRSGEGCPRAADPLPRRVRALADPDLSRSWACAAPPGLCAARSYDARRVINEMNPGASAWPALVGTLHRDRGVRRGRRDDPVPVAGQQGESAPRGTGGRRRRPGPPARSALLRRGTTTVLAPVTPLIARPTP